MINVSTFGIEPSKEYPDLIKNAPIPEFAQYQEKLAELQFQLDNYQKYPKIIVIGNGGSITTFGVYVRALKGNGKKVFLLNTNEPDLINNLKKDYTKVDTVVICVSKSGSTVSNIESVLQFQDYPVIVVVEDEASPLGQIAQHFKWKIIKHPKIGGRFSSFTTSAFVPAYLFGLPIDRLQHGANDMFKRCLLSNQPKDNPAWSIASVLYRLGLIGKEELFIQLYSYYLETSSTLLMQLIHETLGKNGLGTTAVVALAPESQHHTNQRYFGGKKNMVGIFVSVKEVRDSESKTVIPEELSSVTLRDGTLGQLNNLPLKKSLEDEYLGTKQTAQESQMPFIDIVLDKIDSAHIAGFIAMWQMAVYYLSLLESVDPLTQPAVERSKEISWRLRVDENQTPTK